MPSPPYTPYSNSQPPTNPGASPPYSNFSPAYSKGTPSPQSSCGYQNDSYSPYSSTPIGDHMIPSSAPPQSMNQYVNQQTTPTNTIFANGIASIIGPPHDVPEQSMEVRATFIPNGNSTSNLTGYSENICVPMGSDMIDVCLSGPQFTQRMAVPSLTHAPSRVRQSVIQNTRQRYSGATPTSGGLAMGHVTRHPDADSSISQWSQWLKGSAPAPVY